MNPIKPYHRQPLKGERVWIEQVKMSDLPEGSHPGQHDESSVGTPLVDGWTAMHPGPHTPEEGLGLKFVYLANSCTGQRIELMLWPELTIKDNRATAQHEFHLGFSLLGGAHHTLGYHTLDEAVAHMVEMSTYRQVFRLAIMLHGMTLVDVGWQVGDKTIHTLDEYHAAVSWGDSEVTLARHEAGTVNDVYIENDGSKGTHMCLVCPHCHQTTCFTRDIRGSDVTHACNNGAVTRISVGAACEVHMVSLPRA